jgi:hypothetical protein
VRTTNVSFLYYFMVISSDRHFHLYSSRNQEGSQLLVTRNLKIIQHSYTTWVSQPGSETEQLTLLLGMWWLAIPHYVMLGHYYYKIILARKIFSAIHSALLFWYSMMNCLSGCHVPAYWRDYLWKSTKDVDICWDVALYCLLLLTQGKFHWLRFLIWLISKLRVEYI